MPTHMPGLIELLDARWHGAYTARCDEDGRMLCLDKSQETPRFLYEYRDRRHSGPDSGPAARYFDLWLPLYSGIWRYRKVNWEGRISFIFDELRGPGENTYKQPQ